MSSQIVSRNTKDSQADCKFQDHHYIAGVVGLDPLLTATNFQENESHWSMIHIDQMQYFFQ